MSQVLEIKFTTSPVHGGDCGRSKPGAGGDLNWTRIVTGNNPVTQSGEVTTCRSCGVFPVASLARVTFGLQRVLVSSLAASLEGR